MNWIYYLFRVSKKFIKISSIVVSVIALAIFLPGIIFGAGSQLLIDRVATEQSQTLNVPFRSNTVTFNFTGGSVMLSSCIDQACTWAIDDAAQILVTRPDGTQTSLDLISDTKDKPALNITDMFQAGSNTVTIHLIDRFKPVRGLAKPLYIVESQTPLAAPRPQIKSIPSGLRNVKHPYALYSKDPVNTFTGSFYLSHKDISIQGRGPVPTFTRLYDSTNNLTGPVGIGWTHNYAMQLLRPDETTEDIVLIGPEGRADRFTFNSGNYTAPAGIYLSLVKNANNTYTVTQKNQTAWSFDETGKLLRITDRFGNQSTLGYDSNGNLVSISDPAGRGSLTIVNDGSGKITSIKDWTNREVKYGYDSSGRLSTVTDREGKVTSYGYDGSTQRILTIKDALNNTVVTNTYDDQGRVATQKDARGLSTGQQTTFAYNTNGDGTKTTVLTYPKTSFEPTWSFVEEDTYDTQGRIIKKVSKPVTNSANWITHEYTYDSNGNRSSFKDGRGNTSSFCYDVDYSGAAISGSRGNLTRTIAPAPSTGANVIVTLNKYDDKNNLTQTVSPKGITSGTSANCSTNFAASINSTYAIDYTYDSEKTKLAAITKRFNEPSAGLKTAVTKYEYTDSANPGLPTKEIAPRGNTGTTPDNTYATSHTYFTSGNKAGMLESSTTPAGAVTKFDYDAVGRKIAMVSPKGNIPDGVPAEHTSNYSYDNEDRLRFAKAPAPAAGQSQLTTETRYDAVGNKTSVIDANGQVTRYVYDERDSLKEVHQSPDTWTDPSINPSNLITTSYQYDNLGNLTRVTRAKGNTSHERVTDYVFDGLNKVMKETQYPSWPTTTPTLVTTYSYDKNGNQATIKDPLGKTTNYTYDALNRLTNITYNSTTTPNSAYSYDPNGNRTRMVDGTGTTNYTYDELDRMITVQVPGPKTVGYRFDLDGNRTKLIYPDNTSVAYTFDKASRLDFLVDWSNRKTDYDYFIDGMPKTVNHEVNGTSAHYTYDNAGRLTQVWNKEGSNTITQHTYTMDKIGNRTKAAEVLTPMDWNAGPITTSRQGTIDYSYDKLYRLTKENRQLPLPQSKEIFDYTYDPVGNRLTEKYTEFGISDTTSFTYDRSDRIKTATGDNDEVYTVDANGNMTKRGNFGDVLYSYDQTNRMITAESRNYTYDGDGNRTKVTERSSFTTKLIDTYIYDVNQELPILLQDKNRKYVWGLELLYTVDTSNNPGIYHFDGLNSMRAITDVRTPDRPRIQMYEDYNAFGNEGYSNRIYEQPFNFTGEQKDEFGETDLLYLRARYYDPRIGRFMTRDKVSGDVTNPLSLNRYSYAHNNPSNLVDKSGNVVWVPALIGIGAGVGATLNVLSSNDKSLTGVADAAWKGAVAGAVGTAAGLGGGAVLATAGVGGVGALAATGATSSLTGNIALNILDGEDYRNNAIPSILGGAVLGPIANKIVPTAGNGLVRYNWGWKPKGYVGPNTTAVYDREFLSNLYQGFWGYTFTSTKK